MSDINEEQKKLYKRAEENDIQILSRWQDPTIEDLKQENKKLNNIIDTILDFNMFSQECPLNLGFNDEKENKAQDVFYKDEYCESCTDDYKKCWLKYFNELNELKGDNK